MLFCTVSLYSLQAVCASPSGLAQPPALMSHANEKPDQALQITPYLWAAGLSGKISPFQRGKTLDVDKSFSDVLAHLNAGGFLNIRARHQRFVLSGDIMYVRTRDARATGPLSAFQIPGLGITLPSGASIDARADTTQFMATMLGGFRLVDNQVVTLDVLGGARLWHISNRIRVSAFHPSTGRHTASYREGFSWIDPLMGARFFLPLTAKWSLHSAADAGGFAAGSDLTWSVLASTTYNVTETLSVSAGYKALSVDYDNHGHVYHILLRGPVAGMTWRF